MRILISGSTGFVGKRLCEYLHRRGHALVALARNPQAANAALYGRARVVQWNPPKVGPWCDELAQVDAVVNVAGEQVIGRWSPKKWEAIRASRVDTTRAIVDAIERAT